MYLLDTNILIHYFSNHIVISELLMDLDQREFSISTLTRLELMLGLSRQDVLPAEIDEYLSGATVLSVTKDITDTAMKCVQKIRKKLKTVDLLILATAVHMKATLITADKDFENIGEYDIMFINVN